jgi:hypothetical protein
MYMVAPLNKPFYHIITIYCVVLPFHLFYQLVMLTLLLALIPLKAGLL